MNVPSTAPSPAESAQTALQMLSVLEADMIALVRLARETVEESVMPDGAYAKASELYRSCIGAVSDCSRRFTTWPSRCGLK